MQIQKFLKSQMLESDQQLVDSFRVKKLEYKQALIRELDIGFIRQYSFPQEQQLEQLVYQQH